MKVLMIAMTSWWEWLHGHFNRNWSILQQMTHDDEIDFLVVVAYVPFTIKRMLKERFMARSYPRSSCVKKTFKFGSWRLTECCLIIQPLWMWKNPESFQKDLKIFYSTIPGSPKSFDLVWCYNPLFPWRRYSRETLVFDAVDNWLTHPSWKHVSAKIAQGYAYIAEQFDVIFTVSQNLLSTLFARHHHAYWVGNGVDIEHFRNRVLGVSKSEIPMVVYSGILQARVDVKLIARCAESYPHTIFMIAGPVWSDLDVSTLAKLANVSLLGMVSYQNLPELFARSWLAIIPHKVDALTISMNPLKLYQYMAANLPVVSTAIPDLPISPFIVSEKSNADFINALYPFLQGKPVVAQYDMDAYDWKSRYQTMKNYIKL